MPSIFTLSGSSKQKRPKVQATRGRKNDRQERSNQSFATFLLETLGPDTKESGHVETAKDIMSCGQLIRDGRKAPKYAAWLKDTLIPDLRASGKRYTARDLAKCARLIGPTKRK